jgi:hypothetical protein
MTGLILASSATPSFVDSVRNKFSFEVEKHEMLGPNGQPTGHYGLFRSDSGECVGRAVKKNYHPHVVSDVLEVLGAASDAYQGLDNAQCYFNDGHYVSVSPSRDQLKISYENDAIFPRVIVRAGYDGRAFHATLGFYRVACSNIAVFKTVGECSFAIRHSAGKFNGNIKKLIEKFSGLLGQWDQIDATVKQMRNQKVNLGDFIRGVYGDVPSQEQKRGLTVYKKRAEAIAQRLIDERNRLGVDQAAPVSGWEAYNAVQGYHQHEASGRVQDLFGKAVRAFSVTEVNTAERLALGLSV